MVLIRPIIGISRQYVRFSYRNVRLIHSSIVNSANPVPHPTAPGPPPPAPSPFVPEPEDRVPRKKRASEFLSEARSSQTSSKKLTSQLKKRFWKEVSVKETPGRSIPLTVANA
jgi:ATP synthase mitochondrial F1 complex assembly factor 2